MAAFRCNRKCYVLDRLFKEGDVYEGDKAPCKHFDGYVKPGSASVAKPADEKQAPGQGRNK